MRRRWCQSLPEGVGCRKVSLRDVCRGGRLRGMLRGQRVCSESIGASVSVRGVVRVVLSRGLCGS